MRYLLLILLLAGPAYSQAEYSIFSDTVGVNDPSPGIGDSLFTLAINELTFMDFEDCGNCPLRAHVMTFIYSRRFPDVKTGKVWLFSDSKRSSKRDIYKTRKFEYLSYKNLCSNWVFHVAPIIIMGTDTIVIDPSTQSRPAMLRDWVRTISDSSLSFLIIKNSKYYTYPKDDYDFFSDNLPLWPENYTFENELDALARKLTIAYNPHFDPAKFQFYRYKLFSIIQ
jgi:glutaminase-like protein